MKAIHLTIIAVIIVWGLVLTIIPSIMLTPMEQRAPALAEFCERKGMEILDFYSCVNILEDEIIEIRKVREINGKFYFEKVSK